jgi:hypothetical protein
MKKLLLLPLWTTLTLAPAVWAQNWASFYDKQTLRYWSQQMPPGIRENMEQVIWPKLTPQEKQVLAGLTIEFPLEETKQPMNFYAFDNGRRKVVSMPISSLRFFADLALAYTWLNENGYSIDTVTDYLAMIKYQWPLGKLAGNPYRPREVLGIPQGASADPSVQRAVQRTFGTAVVFILAHELGHLYHHHAVATSPADSRLQEEEADRFALEITRRISEAPVGMTFFFTIMAHLEPYASDAGYSESRTRATHPVTAARLRAIANGLERQAEDFSRTGTKAATLTLIASEIKVITSNLNDKGVQALFRQKGLTARPHMLGPRRPGGGVTTVRQAQRGPGQLFGDAYTGEWVDAKGTAMEVEMNLNRKGNNVTGEYSFGAGNATINGLIEGDRLCYTWKWGAEYFGKGVLNTDPTGVGLSGTWGYTNSETGGGSWKLRRKSK